MKLPIKKKSPSPPIFSSTARYSAPVCLNPLLQLLLPLPVLSLSLVTITRTPQCPLCWNKRMGFLCCLPTFVVFVLTPGNNLYNVTRTQQLSLEGVSVPYSPSSLYTMFSKVLRLKAKEIWVDRGLHSQASLPPALNCSEQGLGCLSAWKQGSQ